MVWFGIWCAWCGVVWVSVAGSCCCACGADQVAHTLAAEVSPRLARTVCAANVLRSTLSVSVTNVWASVHASCLCAWIWDFCSELEMGCLFGVFFVLFWGRGIWAFDSLLLHGWNVLATAGFQDSNIFQKASNQNGFEMHFECDFLSFKSQTLTWFHPCCSFVHYVFVWAISFEPLDIQELNSMLEHHHWTKSHMSKAWVIISKITITVRIQIFIKKKGGLYINLNCGAVELLHFSPDLIC